MNFEVNGVAYFLTYDNDRKQWFVVRPTENGFLPMSVLDDHPLPESARSRIEIPGLPFGS